MGRRHLNVGCRVTSLQTEKNPSLFPNFYRRNCRQCWTNAHLLIQILREHHVWKMNYSTNKVQVSYFVELSQSNFLTMQKLKTGKINACWEKFKIRISPTKKFHDCPQLFPGALLLPDFSPTTYEFPRVLVFQKKWRPWISDDNINTLVPTGKQGTYRKHISAKEKGAVQNVCWLIQWYSFLGAH